MKKLVALLAILCVSFGANAQDQGSVLLKGYAGYTFANQVNFDYGYVDVQSAFQWGGGLEYFVDKTNSVEVKPLERHKFFSQEKQKAELRKFITIGKSVKKIIKYNVDVLGNCYQVQNEDLTLEIDERRI